MKVTITTRTKIVLSAVWLLSLLCVAIYAELRHRHPRAGEKCELVERSDVDLSESAYAERVATGYRDVRSHRVTIVALTEGTEPARILNCVCEQRGFMARVLARLVQLGASMIVIDKTFGADSCVKDDPGTKELIREVQSSKVPIVVGAATHAAQGEKKKACLVLSPSLEFGQKLPAAEELAGQPAVWRGLDRLNSDVRKIPTNWYIYPNDDASRSDQEPRDDLVGTLSYTAATLLDAHLKNVARLSEMRTLGQHPFTSFVDFDGFPRAEALSLLCSAANKREVESLYSIHCSPHAAPEVDVRGQVVIIGEDVTGRDRHRLLDKDVPGVYLQANYIESLLDDRYFQPIGTARNLPAGTTWSVLSLVIWIAILYGLFWFVPCPEIALVISTALGGLTWWILNQLVVIKGLYFEPVQAIGFLALVVKYIEARGHILGEHLRQGIKDAGGLKAMAAATRKWLSGSWGTKGSTGSSGG